MPSTFDSVPRKNLFYPQFYFNAITLFIFIFILFISDDYIKRALFNNNITYSVLLLCGALFVYYLYCQAGDYLRYTERMKYFSLMTALQPYFFIFL